MVRLFLHYSKKKNEVTGPLLADEIGKERSLGSDSILQRCKAGEDSAWSELHGRYSPFVHGLILASGYSADDADELTQETFLRVFRKIHELKDGATFPAWLRAITKNLIVDRIRSGQRRPQTIALGIEHTKPVTDANDEVANQVLACIRSLPTAYREPLILRLVEGLSGLEIAQLTGLTPESVRVNLYRGMAQLRELLKKDGLP
ncbi:MAG: RNA polymerase sigma-70 factor (ECF subfamily) [Planctomycetota bacterium]|jgi:RNA polymerase sigma-70 factor (ECF subfamily)